MYAILKKLPRFSAVVFTANELKETAHLVAIF